MVCKLLRNKLTSHFFFVWSQWNFFRQSLIAHFSVLCNIIYHQILLTKLQDVGASTSVLQWFNSYLTNRYQVVRIHSTVSDYSPYYLVYTLMIYQKLHRIALLNAM